MLNVYCLALLAVLSESCELLLHLCRFFQHYSRWWRHPSPPPGAKKPGAILTSPPLGPCMALDTGNAGYASLPKHLFVSPLRYATSVWGHANRNCCENVVSAGVITSPPLSLFLSVLFSRPHPYLTPLSLPLPLPLSLSMPKQA